MGRMYVRDRDEELAHIRPVFPSHLLCWLSTSDML